MLAATGCALACAAPAGAATNGRIAFTSFRDGGVGRIHTMAPDGSGQRAVSPGPDAQSDFSPDGGSIAFRRGTTGEYEVWVMGAGGEAPRQLTETPGTANSTQPAWLPDGSGLLFRRGSNRASDIWRLAPDGSGQAAVVTVADDQWYPSASPATGRILFATTVTSRDRKIQDAAADGSGVRTLRDVAGSYDSAPAYSPDGRRIAFESDADGDMEIYVMDADGGDVRQVTRNTVHDEGPVFSPDGTQIAFTRGPDNADGDIWTMNAEGGGERQLTTSPGRDESPDWQPLSDPAPTPTGSPTPTASSTPTATPTPAPTVTAAPPAPTPVATATAAPPAPTPVATATAAPPAPTPVATPTAAPIGETPSDVPAPALFAPVAPLPSSGNGTVSQVRLRLDERRPRLSVVLRRGLRVRAGAPRPAVARLTGRAARTATRRVREGRYLIGRSPRLARGENRLRLRFDRATIRLLRDARSLVLELRLTTADGSDAVTVRLRR